MINVTIKQVRAFVAAAEARSFIEGSSAIHLSQPALSAAISKLEHVLGGKLIARTTRTLALTHEGEAFLPVARQLLADWDNSITDVYNLFSKNRGRLNIAAMPSFAANQLPELLLRFHQQYKNINITVQDVVAESVTEMIRFGKVEIGITFDPQESEDLKFTPLFNDTFVAILPTNHTLKQKSKVNWQDLQSSPLILLQSPSSIRKQINKIIIDNKLSVSIEFESHQLATIGRMVGQGLGVSIVPMSCIGEMEKIGTIYRPLIAPETSHEVGILTRRRYPLSTAAQAMVNIFSEHYHQPCAAITT